jgi:uncharacterized Zn-finger protein
LEEQIVQQFSRRCPYCDEILVYDRYNRMDLKAGENEIVCPSCKRVFIKVVPDSCGKE